MRCAGPSHFFSFCHLFAGQEAKWGKMRDGWRMWNVGEERGDALVLDECALKMLPKLGSGGGREGGDGSEMR